jgi:hypothetical protein
MLVFIDESGCSGFKFSRGSDPVFALAMVVFADSEAASRTDARIQELHEDLGHAGEFKFSKCRDEVRDGFFNGIRACPFKVRALVVEKDVLYSGKLRADTEAFYSFFVKQIMRCDGGTLENARVRIDGCGDRKFVRALTAYLRRELSDKIRDVRMSDSERDPLIQLADMSVGAIARSFRKRPDADRWRKQLSPRIQDVWPYK